MTINPRIKTGIDLNKIRDKDIKIDANNINIELPPIEVLVFDYPSEKGVMDTELSKTAFGTRLKINEIEAIHRATENDIRKQLNFMQIRERSEKRTKILLERYLHKIGFEQVTIKFSKPPKQLLYFRDLTEDELTRLYSEE